MLYPIKGRKEINLKELKDLSCKIEEEFSKEIEKVNDLIFKNPKLGEEYITYY